MEVLTGPALLHATDVVAVKHLNGRIACGSFNVVGNRSFAPARAEVRINGKPTPLHMQQNPQTLVFEFSGGLVPKTSLSTLPLSVGMNSVEFYIPNEGSPGEGVTASASVWLWMASDRVVVVDIDGTITKSDVRGLLANQVQGTASFLSNAFAASNQWTSDAIKNTARSADYNHEGVADAIAYIARKGYRILYLTARPISMAAGTRTYLVSVGLPPGSKLPDGALITQPCGTMKALTARHDEFKISVLTEIQALFEAEAFYNAVGSPGNGRSVFAAGFGNSDTDVVAYDHVGIPRGNIFVADKTSRIKNLENDEYQSYTGLMPHLDVFFPGAEAHPYSQPCVRRKLEGSDRPHSSENLLSHVASKLEDMLPGAGRKSPVSPPRSWPGQDSQFERPRQPASESSQPLPPAGSGKDQGWSARGLVESLVPGCSGPRVTQPQQQPPQAQAHSPSHAAVGSGGSRGGHVPLGGGQQRMQGQDLFRVNGGGAQRPALDATRVHLDATRVHAEHHGSAGAGRGVSSPKAGQDPSLRHPPYAFQSQPVEAGAYSADRAGQYGYGHLPARPSGPTRDANQRYHVQQGRSQSCVRGAADASGTAGWQREQAVQRSAEMTGGGVGKALPRAGGGLDKQGQERTLGRGRGEYRL